MVYVSPIGVNALLWALPSISKPWKKPVNISPYSVQQTSLVSLAAALSCVWFIRSEYITTWKMSGTIYYLIQMRKSFLRGIYPTVFIIFQK